MLHVWQICWWLLERGGRWWLRQWGWEKATIWDTRIADFGGMRMLQHTSCYPIISYPWRMKVRSSFSIIDFSCGWQGVSGIYLELQPYSKEALVVNISGLSGLGARDMTFVSCTAVCSTYHPAYVDKRTGLRVNASKPGRKPKHHTSCLPFFSCNDGWSLMMTNDSWRWWMMIDNWWWMMIVGDGW